MPRTVLLITHSDDDPAELVANAVRERGWVAVRFDTDRFPAEVDLRLETGSGEQPSFELSDGDVAVDLRDVEAIWYRRFYSAKLPDSVEERYVKYSQQEARTLLLSLFAALSGARWVDRIERVHRAHHKLLQLEVAKRCGLRVPDTLATNDAARAREFYDAHPGGVVTKMLNSISMREDGREQMVFTSEVGEADFDDIEGLRVCPAVFQEKVEKDVELRIAVVGDQLFCASIDASSSDRGAVDWRRDSQLTRSFQADSVPDEVAAGIRRLMAEYGLVYGSIDVIRRPDGQHVKVFCEASIAFPLR